MQINSIRTSAKDGRECEICLKEIHKGERYVRMNIPPWEGEPDFDVDDYGKPVFTGFINTHKWEVHTTHLECEKRREEELGYYKGW